MKKTFKLIMGLLMASVMCFSMVGCGTSSTEENSEETATEVSANGNSDGGDVSETLQRLRKNGKIVVGSAGDIFNYIDKDTGELKGVDADILKAAANKLGIPKVEMKLIPFSEFIVNLNENNVDIIADCMYVNEDRANKVYFGDVWYTQGDGLLVQQESSINSIDDFDPKTTRIGYTPGTLFQNIVEDWANKGLIKEAVPTGDQSESIVALQHGKIDAFITDSTIIEDLFANKTDTVKGLRMADNYKSLMTGRIAPAMNFEDKDFVKELNQAIYELREDGTIAQIFKDNGLNPELHMITNSEEDRTPGVNKE